jgi:pimeloyl-ACP methyl ester carboxylesterase
MQEILYLHGFGQTMPERCSVLQALENAMPAACFHAPCYHPGGQIVGTRITPFLKSCERIIERSKLSRVHLVGYSFGGLLAAILAWKREDLIENVLVLAPAIDNWVANLKIGICLPNTWKICDRIPLVRM